MSLIKEKAALAAKIAKLINSVDSREIANQNILDFFKNETLSATAEQQISDTLTQSMRLSPEHKQFLMLLK